MHYEFLYSEDVLIIRLSGAATVNERLLTKGHLAAHLGQSHRKIIVDLGGVHETGEVYIVGVMNTIQKEFRLWGGEVKFSGPRPELRRHFGENRLDTIFDIGPSIEEVKSKFKEKGNEA